MGSEMCIRDSLGIVRNPDEEDVGFVRFSQVFVFFGVLEFVGDVRHGRFHWSCPRAPGWSGSDRKKAAAGEGVKPERHMRGLLRSNLFAFQGPTG